MTIRVFFSRIVFFGSPIYEIAQLAKNKVAFEGLRPLQSEKKPKTRKNVKFCTFFIITFMFIKIMITLIE